MSPIFGVIAVIWIIRVFSNHANSGSTVEVRQNTEVSKSFLAVLLKIFVFLLASIFAAESGNVVSIRVLQVLAIPILLPSLFLDWVIVPLGMPRLAYWYFRSARPFGFGKEARVGAVFFGALALARRGARPEQVEWLKERLATESSSNVAYEVTLGLLNALNGERETAQRIFEAFDDHYLTRGFRKLRLTARDWLVMHAARCGNWQEVIARGRRGRNSYRWSYAVARIAERLDRRPQALSNWQLWVLWLCAPRQAKLLPFARQAKAVLWTAEEPDSTPPFPKDLAGALANLANMLVHATRTGSEPARDEFLSTVRWVNVRLESPILHAQIQERLRALGSLNPGSADAVVNNFRDQLIVLVTTIIEQSPQLVGGEGERPVIKQAVENIRQAAFQDIEVRCGDYVNRTRSQTSFDTEAEWSAWAKLRTSADRLLKIAPDTEDAVFRETYAPLCNFAVYQHNVLGRHRLAHDMFLWLFEHARSDPAAVDMLETNLGRPPASKQQGYAWLWKFWIWNHWVLLLLSVLIFIQIIIWAGRDTSLSRAPQPQALQPANLDRISRKPIAPIVAPAPRDTATQKPAVRSERLKNEELPLPKHGGQVLGSHWKNYEVVVAGRVVTVYLTEQDHGFDLEGATGHISYRQIQPHMIRRFELHPIGKDRMSVTIPDAPFEPGDQIWIYVAPRNHAESSLDVEVPAPTR